MTERRLCFDGIDITTEGNVLKITLSAYHQVENKAYRCSLEVPLGHKLRVLNICLQETDA